MREFEAILLADDGLPGCVCNACGSYNVFYDTNPHNLPVIGKCSMGADMTGEPGASRCADCRSLDIREYITCQDNVFRDDGSVGHCILDEMHEGPHKDEAAVAAQKAGG